MFKRLLFLISFFSIIFFLSGIFATYHFFFDWMAQFHLHFLLLFSLLIILFLMLKEWKAILVFSLPVIWILVSIVPFYFNTDVKQGKEKLSFCSMNLLTTNRESSKVLEYLEESEPDVILFQEYGSFWNRELSKLKKDFPYRITEVRDDNFGMALFSKYPLEKESVVFLHQENIPYIVADIIKNNRRISFLNVHTMPPVGTDYFKLRNKQLKTVNRYIKNHEGPLIVAGDFNCTTFSPCMNLMLEKTNLKDSRQGKGIQNSWPAGLVFLGLTLDHVFISENIQVEKRKTGDEIGSDHHPLFLRINW